ncbi:hypothetical protein MMC21_003839 [Puttea exsequens]|nr:hypothetical protein [Puttea exsequens]
MIIIGLTGALATGKSTVSRLLSSPPHNLPIIDADLLARQVVEPGTYGYRQILKHFGPTTPDLLLPPLKEEDEGGEGAKAGEKQGHNGKGRPLNRAVLGRRVFGSEPERVKDRAVLNGIVHPLVRLRIFLDILYYHFRGHWAVILDIPLLYESALDIFCSIVIMVAVSFPEVQMQRLRARDTALTESEARDRVGSQMGVGEKVERTRARGRRGKVVWNDGGEVELRGEVGSVIQEVRMESGGMVWGWWLWGSPVGCVGVSVWEVFWGWRARRRWVEERKRKRAKL